MEVNISDEIGCWNREAIEAHARKISVLERELQKRSGATICAGSIACDGCIANAALGTICKEPVITPSQAQQGKHILAAEFGDQTAIKGLRIIK